MLILLSNTDTWIMAVSYILILLSDFKIFFIIVALIAFLIISIYFKLKRKKNGIKEVIHPVTDIIGTDPDRLAELNNDLEPFGFSYEPNQDVFYSLLNPWQKKVGYCRLYDEASAPLSMIIDCEPIRFEYNGKKWLIEFWKGQYGMTTGGEVGIYYTTGLDLNIPGIFNGTFYSSLKDEDFINMSFVFRKKGNLLFTRNGYHWWLTGFKLGEFSKPSDLTMDIVMDLYDKQMADVFIRALKKAGYKDDEYAVYGRRVYVRFSKTHTQQPITRTTLTNFIMQRNNESFCISYNSMTQEYTDTLDKLEIVRNESPTMYDKILNMGKAKAVFDSYNKIKSFLTNEDNGKE